MRTSIIIYYSYYHYCKRAFSVSLPAGESIWGQCLYPSSKVFPPGHAPLDLPSARDSKSVIYIYSYSPQFDYISCGGYVSSVEYCFRRLRSSAPSMQKDVFEMYFMNRVSENSDYYHLSVDRVLKFGGHSSSDRQYNESCSNETDLYEICCAKENIIVIPTNHLKDILLLKIAPYSSPNANTLLLAQTNNSVVTTSYDAASLNMTLILDIDDTSSTDLIPHFRLIISPTPQSSGSTQSALGIGLGLSAGGVTILICFMVIVTVVVCIVAKQRCVKVVSFQLEMEAREGVQEHVLGGEIIIAVLCVCMIVYVQHTLIGLMAMKPIQTTVAIPTQQKTLGLTAMRLIATKLLPLMHVTQRSTLRPTAMRPTKWLLPLFQQNRILSMEME